MRAYKTLLIKAYFDKGFSITNYLKYVLVVFGFASHDVMRTMLLAAFYAGFCFVVGWCWYNFDLIQTENEIQNLFNPFQKEVREKLIK